MECGSNVHVCVQLLSLLLVQTDEAIKVYGHAAFREAFEMEQTEALTVDAFYPLI